MKSLTPRELTGLQKIGDCLIPGDAELKSFSQSQCALQVDRILDYMPTQDLKDLKMLLGLLSYPPKFFVSLLVRFLELSPALPLFMGGSILRFIRLGIRGLVMSLYYSHPDTLSVLGYQVKVFTDDLPQSKKAQPQPPVGLRPGHNPST